MADDLFHFFMTFPQDSEKHYAEYPPGSVATDPKRARAYVKEEAAFSGALRRGSRRLDADLLKGYPALGQED